MSEDRHRAFLELLLLILVIHIGIAASRVEAQSQDVINANNASAIDSVRRDVDEYRNERIPARVDVLESDMYEIKWLTRGMTIAVVGQIVERLFGKKRT